MDSYSIILYVLIYAGAFFLCVKLFSFIRLLFSLFVLSGTSFSTFGPKGSWAVVTGASDGIGKEFASQLAARGFNIVLVSRTASKLSLLAQELKSEHGVQAKVLDMDFSQNAESDYRRLQTLLQGLEISILINNVGQSHSMPVPFLDTPEKEMQDIITINCIGTLKITQMIAPIMVQRKRGLILTMGSFGGIVPTPLLATYSGSKAFLQQWSTALASELKSSNVQVEIVHSYLITSAMSKIKRASIMIPNPKTFVKSALRRIGRTGGAQGAYATSTPYWTHGIMHWALTTFTGTMTAVVVDRNRIAHERIRQSALRKQAREGKKSL